jgi:hypothetical protein
MPFRIGFTGRGRDDLGTLEANPTFVKRLKAVSLPHLLALRPGEKRDYDNRNHAASVNKHLNISRLI